MVLFAEASWWTDQDTYVVRKAPTSFHRRLSPRKDDTTDQRVADLVVENRALQDTIDAIRASHSWRLTAPMRGLSKLIKASRATRSLSEKRRGTPIFSV